LAATPTIVVPPLDFVIDRREKGVGWPYVASKPIAFG
jgi:hypothetical protein